MNGKYRLLFLLVTVLLLWKSFHHFGVFRKKEDDGFDILDIDALPKVKVSVYYEALCPDSKFFIVSQIQPAYEKLTEHVAIDFVPYGKAKTLETDGKITFECQHDALECYANTIHSCVLDLVKDPLTQVKYISCMITDNMIPDDAGQKCGSELNVDFGPIGECAKSVHGTRLLKKYGERTHSLKPPVKFIPTIELNGSQTVVSQSAILKDLFKSLCQILKWRPKQCSQ